ELVHFRSVDLHPVRGIVLRLGEIGLHEMSPVMRGCLRKQARALPGKKEQDGCNGKNGDEGTPGALEEAPDKQGAEGGGKKRESIDAGPSRELQQGEIARNGIAEEVPREADDGEMRAKEFKRHPEKRREKARE